MGIAALSTALAENVRRASLSEVRYKCIVAAANDLSTIEELVHGTEQLLKNLGHAPTVLAASEFLDDIGAVSAQDAADRLDRACRGAPVLVEGPLVFSDYWTEGTRTGFWRWLAALTTGRGIALFDAFRDSGIVPDFDLRQHDTEASVRIYRSRLDPTEDFRR